MSYRCKTCNKELEDYIFVCDHCGTKKPSIKIKESDNGVSEERKVEETKKDKEVRIILSILIVFVHIGVLVYGFYNFTTFGTLFLYIFIAYILIVIGRYSFPKSILLRVFFYIETYGFFSIIAIPIRFLLPLLFDK